MSKVSVIDSHGLIVRQPNSLQPVKADNPAYRARIALALPQGAWLYAPTAGHTLDQFKKAKTTDASRENFGKIAKLYLAPYGAQVTSIYLARGIEALTVTVSKETIFGT